MSSTNATPGLNLYYQIPQDLRVREEFGCTPPKWCEEDFRHSGWAPLRQRIFNAMIAAKVSANRLDSFACCGSGTQVWFRDETGEIALKGSYCHDRFCQVCARARGEELRRAMHRHIPTATRLRFVTLTLRHSALPLADILERLRDAFTKLRNRKWWKARVRGGVCVLEVKLSKAGLWHAHLHMILESEFLKKSELADEWVKITGDSYIVDVKQVKDDGNDIDDLGRYLTKYVTKPAGLDVITDQDKLVEYMLAMQGQRIMNFLGSWRGIMSDDEDQDEDNIVDTDHGWRRLFWFDDLHEKAAQGEEFAARVLEGLKRKLEALPMPDLIEQIDAG